jgi:hypothetical protein
MRYVDGTLLIYNSVLATAEQILEDHSSLCTKIKYEMETERMQDISFLETNTDSVLHSSSAWPKVHKVAAFSYMLNRIHKTPITIQEETQGN